MKKTINPIKQAFSLAEAMITLLIVSLILAAVVPVVSKRQSTPDKIWNYTQSGVGSDQADVYWGLRDGQTALIGSYTVPDSAAGSRLTIITPPDDSAQTNEALKYAVRRPILAFYQRTSATTAAPIGKISFDQSNNIAVGLNTLKYNYSGTHNTVVGANTFVGNSTNTALNTGQSNVAIGDTAMYNAYSGGFASSNCFNTAVGVASLYNNQGYSNVGIGINALYTNTTGLNNTAVGTNSMYYATDNGSASSNEGNTALGVASLLNNRGFDNVAIGRSSLNATNTGSSNTAIGSGSGSAITAGSGNICVGLNAGPTSNQSDKLYIDNVQTDTPLIGGDFSTNFAGIGTASPTANLEVTSTGATKLHLTSPSSSGLEIRTTSGTPYLDFTSFSTSNAGSGTPDFSARIATDANYLAFHNHVSSTAQTAFLNQNGTIIFDLYNSGAAVYSYGGYTSSDRRWKKNITPLKDSLANLLKLQGVNYYWRKKEFPKKPFNDKRQIGLIAQDVEKIYPELVFTDNEGYKNLDYSKFTPILIESVKEFYSMLIEQKDKMTQSFTALTQRIVTIENKLLKQDKKINNLENEVKGLKQQNAKIKAENKAIKSQNDRIQRELNSINIKLQKIGI